MNMQSNGTVYDERRPRWWDKWINPTTVLSLIGGIVWGVQLNMYVVSLAEDQAKLEGRQYELTQQLQVTELNQARQTIILDNLIKKLDGVEVDLESLEKEVKEWEQKILRNSLHNELGNP